MLIDSTHRGWILGTAAAFVLSTIIYVVYAAWMPGGPSGGTWPGLIYGLLGSALMIAAGLLSARKRAPTRRIGRAATWLKAHIWLGLLSFPLILYHSAFRWGGLVEQLLWFSLVAVVGSGIFGLVMQHYIPRMMSSRVPLETIYEQIDRICAVMRDEADELVEEICGPLPESVKPVDPEAKPARKKKAEVASGSGPLKEFYLRQVRPFLDPVYDRTNRLSRAPQADGLFEQMRKRLPPDLEAPLNQLAAFCDERRQFALQTRLHHWLHGWLFIHVPLSFALLVLGLAHAFMAIYY